MTLFWLSAAVLVVSAGYGALMPLLPSWLKPLMQAEAQAQMARHVGWLSSAYTAGILLGALFWGSFRTVMGAARCCCWAWQAMLSAWCP